VYQLILDFKKAYDSVRKAVLYNILIQFGIHMNLIRLIKMCLTETYSRVRVGKICLDIFPIKMVLNMKMFHRHCCQALPYSILLGGFS
jgi:hypothetical protein